MKYGLCPKCHKMTTLTRHHIFPRRFFKNSPIFFVCRECHDKLECLIPYSRMERYLYVDVLVCFLKNKVIIPCHDSFKRNSKHINKWNKQVSA